MTETTNHGKVESIITELRSLAAQQPLRDPGKLARAKDLMHQLRAMGFGIREIVELTGGGWSEATVKAYTAGVGISDAEVKGNIASILARMVQKGVGLDGIKNVLEFMDAMHRKGVQSDDLFILLEQAIRANINPADIVKMYATLRSKIQDVPIDRLAKAVPYIVKLAEQKDGFSPELLGEVIQSAENQGGDAKKVLESINAQGSLNEIQDKVKKEQAHLDKLTTQVATLDKKQREIESNLKLCQELESLGYSIQTLKKLKQNAEKFGKLDDLLEGLREYSSLKQIRSALEQARKELKDLQSEIRRTKTDHSQLQLAIDLCNTLLFELKWTETTLKKIHKLTVSYGSPIEVIEALIKYSNIDSLDKKIEELSNAKRALESEITQLNESIAKLRGEVDGVKELHEGFVNAIGASTYAAVMKNLSSINDIFNERMRHFTELCKELANNLATAKILEHELNVARFFFTAIKAPEQASDIPLGYGYVMIVAASSIFKAHNFNPSSKPGQETTAYGVLPITELPLSAILDWAKRAAASDPRVLDGWSSAGGAA